MKPRITFNSSYDNCSDADKEKIGFYLEQLAEQVERNAQDLLTPRYTKNPNPENPKLNNWYLICQEYFDSGIPPADIYMTYGYAVEELTNKSYIPVSHPYSLKIQVTYGNSRCDYELGVNRNRQYTVLAWIDITSEDSEGHIWKKSGGRWHSAPCACELLYKPLKPEILPEQLDGSIGQNIHTLSQIRQRNVSINNYNSYLDKCMRKVAHNLFINMGNIEKSQVPGFFTDVFQMEMPHDCHIVCHGLLVLWKKLSSVSGRDKERAQSVINYYYWNHHYHSTDPAKQYLQDSYRRNAEGPYVFG